MPVRLNNSIPEKLYNQLKANAIDKGIPINQFVIRVLQDWVDNNSKYNKSSDKKTKEEWLQYFGDQL